MAWGKPKRNGGNPCCGRKGQCSCQRRINAELARNPSALAHCTRACGGNGNKPCGRLARGGVCPCPDC